MVKVIIILCVIVNCYGHGLVHQQISRVSEEIEAHPERTKLLLERALLFQDHGDLEKCRGDLQQAILLGDQSVDVYELLARIEERSGKLDEALKCVRKYVAVESVSQSALRQAAVFFRKGDFFEEAAVCWERFGRASYDFRATDYDDAASVNLRLKRMKVARNFLDEGLKKFSRSVPLNLRRAEWDIASGKADTAVKRFSDLRKAMEGAASSLALKEAKIWEHYEDDAQVKRVANEGLQALNALPLRLRKRPSMVELSRELLILTK